MDRQEGVRAAERAMAFLRNVTGATRVAFYRVDSELGLGDFILHDVPHDFYRGYIAGMDRFDPLHARHAGGRTVARLGHEFRAPVSAEIAAFQGFCRHFDIGESLEFFFRHDGQVFAGINIAWTGGAVVPDGVMQLAWHLHDYVEHNLGIHARPDTMALRMARYQLTPRERQVLDMLCCGRTNRDISEALNISLATVKTHLIHVFDKMGVETRSRGQSAERGFPRRGGT
jgi:DNA-binding CsgD family transcriptional regulator